MPGLRRVRSLRVRLRRELGPRRDAVGAPTISGVATSIAAFVGPTTAGPRDTPVRVTSLADYLQAFGSLDADDTGCAVQLFFENGGRNAYVVRTDDVEGRGLQALASIDLFNLLVIPGTARLGEDDAARVADAAAIICEQRRAFYLVDPPAFLSAEGVQAWKAGLTATANSALYFPALEVDDPLNPAQLREVPPSGAVAGVVARVDSERGVWMQPAGTRARLRGVRGLTASIGESESELLAAAGINALRSFTGQGSLVWGARTLTPAAEPQWRYVSVRRLVLFVEESLDRGTRWVVFEPNDEPLWRAVRSSVESFLLGLFQQGALQGRTPDEGYFVRCDRMTMTQEDIDNGRLICLVGIAPVRPAEFVTLRIQTSLAH